MTLPNFKKELAKMLEAIADELEKRGEDLRAYEGSDDEYSEGRRMGMIDLAEHLRRQAEKFKQT